MPLTCQKQQTVESSSTKDPRSDMTSPLTLLSSSTLATVHASPALANASPLLSLSEFVIPCFGNSDIQIRRTLEQLISLPKPPPLPANITTNLYTHIARHTLVRNRSSHSALPTPPPLAPTSLSHASPTSKRARNTPRDRLSSKVRSLGAAVDILQRRDPGKALASFAVIEGARASEMPPPVPVHPKAPLATRGSRGSARGGSAVGAVREARACVRGTIALRGIPCAMAGDELREDKEEAEREQEEDEEDAERTEDEGLLLRPRRVIQAQDSAVSLRGETDEEAGSEEAAAAALMLFMNPGAAVMEVVPSPVVLQQSSPAPSSTRKRGTPGVGSATKRTRRLKSSPLRSMDVLHSPPVSVSSTVASSGNRSSARISAGARRLFGAALPARIVLPDLDPNDDFYAGSEEEAGPGPMPMRRTSPTRRAAVEQGRDPSLLLGLMRRSGGVSGGESSEETEEEGSCGREEVELEVSRLLFGIRTGRA
ncbi:hypothetical protein BC830DRAFT_1131021 [Chytriomyces sp. MP71]|nr:hypothetical protein BC830DRAFT_1131021 [Chytriomyces sp. MP71]